MPDPPGAVGVSPPAAQLGSLMPVAARRQSAAVVVVAGVALLVAILAQTSAVLYLPSEWPRTDWVLALAVGWSFRRRRGEGTVLALVGGALLDWMSAAPFGLHVVALGVPLLAIESAGTAATRSWPRRIVATLAAVSGTHLLILGMLGLRGWGVPWRDVLLSVSVPAAAADVVAVLVIYVILGWLQRGARALHGKWG